MRRCLSSSTGAAEAAAWEGPAGSEDEDADAEAAGGRGVISVAGLRWRESGLRGRESGLRWRESGLWRELRRCLCSPTGAAAAEAAEAEAACEAAASEAAAAGDARRTCTAIGAPLRGKLMRKLTQSPTPSPAGISSSRVTVGPAASWKL